MTQNNDHDFQQFRGQFDDAMMPGDAFKAKMEKLLQSEKPVEAERTSSVIASPSTQNPSTFTPPRRSHPLMVAAAALTVFAVVIASVWVLSGEMLEGEYASAPAGIATVPADAPGMPGEDVALEPQLLTDAVTESYMIGMYGDVLLTTTWVADDTGFGKTIVTAVDRNTGEILWSKDHFDIQQVTSSGGTIVALRWHFNADGILEQNIQSMIAFHATTGVILWEHPMPGGEFPEIANYYTNPVTIGDLVIVASPTGSATAWDVKTGDPRWEQDFDPGRGYAVEIYVNDNESVTGTYRPLSATSWNNQFVVANGDGLITVMNPETGAIQQEFSPVTPKGETVSADYVRLDSFPGAIVLSIVPIKTEPEVVAVDPVTEEVIWAYTTEISATTYTTVNEDGSVAWSSHEWVSTNWLQQLFGNHGHSTMRLVWVDGRTGEEILSTERIRVNSIYMVNSDGQYVCTQMENYTCYDRSGTRHIVEGDSIGEALLVNGELYYSTEDGLYRVELPWAANLP